MIFILEGCDGTGKSTLAKSLAKRHDMEIIHFTSPKTDDEDKAMFDKYAEVLTLKDNVILDRCWYSDIIYGTILRGKTYMTLEKQTILEQMLYNKGGQIYWCTDSAKNIIKRIDDRGDDLIKTSQIFDILDGYNRVMRTINRSIPVVKYTIPEVDTDGKELF